VLVPAKLTVDGKTYFEVGVHFPGHVFLRRDQRGEQALAEPLARLGPPAQDLGGYRTLNLLNSHEDPTFLRPVLYNLIAREYLPAAKANLVRVAINGESWGVYINLQQVNKDFLKEWFGTTKGSRWKVQGSPGGRGSLAYLGDDVEKYKRIYTIKTKDDPEAWAALIKLTKVLNETPADKLEEALSPLLDIDGALKFLALENALVNNDGYWIRTSDYSLYLDGKKRFHVIPHDTNETFSRPGGPGFGGGGGPGGGFNFSRGRMAEHMLSQADKNKDQSLTREELAGLADAWFDKLDRDSAGKLNEEQFTGRVDELLPSPQDGPGGPPGGRARSRRKRRAAGASPARRSRGRAGACEATLGRRGVRRPGALQGARRRQGRLAHPRRGEGDLREVVR
jgi:spore coat protein CotH